jgi:hypothetical protein
VNDLADPTEPLALRQTQPPRVAVHVDLHAISRDLQDIKAELARRPTRWDNLKLALGCLAAVVVALLLIR